MSDEDKPGWVDASGFPEIKVGRKFLGSPTRMPATGDPAKDKKYSDPKFAARLAEQQRRIKEAEQQRAVQRQEWEARRANDE